jgi:hypothetical protein
VTSATAMSMVSSFLGPSLGVVGHFPVPGPNVRTIVVRPPGAEVEDHVERRPGRPPRAPRSGARSSRATPPAKVRFSEADAKSSRTYCLTLGR